jgi:LPS export ABC transporter protein LptC
MRYFFPHDTSRGMAIILWMSAMSLFFIISGCREKKELVDIVFDRELSYTAKSTEVVTFISDSGRTRFKITTDEWYIYDEASEPYSYFPEKVYGEMLDSLFQVEASFDADTAYYYSKKKLWKFVDNVKAVNREGELFETSLLFWDENERTIYSDRFIRITKGDFINTGTGFESNETMSQYRIYNATAEIPVQENTPADSVDIEKTPLL